ncbi:MAG TPA: response regulator transcription factor [Polyangia bacterium]|nr:response regulator transcription factor [Polyangia bacterium]
MIVRILLVDDDVALAGILAPALGDEGFQVVTARTGKEGLQRFEADGADLLILDILMPEMDGLEVCRRVRRKSAVPIILLSSRGEEVDRVTGLETGADDYVTKPFSTRELVARIRAIERRVGGAPAPTAGGAPVRVGPLAIDAGRFAVKWRDQAVVLTKTEFQLLEALARHPGLVLSRDQLLDKARGDEVTVTERTVDTFIKRLRKKIRDVDPSFDEIETVIGVGYRYRE